MSDERDRRVRWHDNGRGPRVVIEIGTEDVVTSTDAARELRDDLTAVLEEIAAANMPRALMSDADPDAHGGRYVEPFDRSKP